VQLLEIGKFYSGLFSCQFCKDLLWVEVVVRFNVQKTDDAEKLKFAERALVDCFKVAEELRERDSD